jgi:DNA-binding NtrC family response regulator
VVLRIRLPPLRERPGDLEPLVAALSERLHAREGLPRARIEASAIARMRRHDWPGNVRELESVLARALVLRAGRPVRAVDLRFDVSSVATGAGDVPLEVAMIREALRSEPASLAAAARRIGWTRQKLSRRMHALGMTT